MPITNITGTENRSCNSNNTGVAPSNNPLHLFGYHRNFSSPLSSSPSAQSYSGIIPIRTSTSPLVTSPHRNTKHSLHMSTESDTDPDNSPAGHDILSDSNFARGSTNSGLSSASLFYTLSGRVQNLMNRAGGGSSMSGRLQQYIQGIQVIILFYILKGKSFYLSSQFVFQSPDPDIKLTTLNELCSVCLIKGENFLLEDVLLLHFSFLL